MHGPMNIKFAFESSHCRDDKHKQNTYNVTLQSVWVTIVERKRSNKCHNIMSVCVSVSFFRRAALKPHLSRVALSCHL